MSGKIATSVAGFAVLPLHIPAQPSFPRETVHYVYIRENAPRIPTPDTPRELFVVNVPIDATLNNIRALFAEQLGGARVADVEFGDVRVGRGGIKAAVIAPEGNARRKRKRGVEEEEGESGGEEVGLLPEIWDREIHHSGTTAVVRFVDRESAELTLKVVRRVIKSGKGVSWNMKQEAADARMGSARYLAHHRLQYPNPAVLQDSVDAFMAAFASQEASRARQRAQQRSVPDEDGFITVTRGGRSGPAREEEARAKEEELKLRDKNRIKGDFYRFQVRERKKEQAKDLVKSFEADRRRLDEMRKRRGKIRPE